jgi:hypothetical protein
MDAKTERQIHAPSQASIYLQLNFYSRSFAVLIRLRVLCVFVERIFGGTGRTAVFSLLHTTTKSTEFL